MRLIYLVMRPDEASFSYPDQAIPERDVNNQILGYMGTVTDITERKQAEDLILKKTTFRNDNK
jgi:PAS domain-containing protein